MVAKLPHVANKDNGTMSKAIKTLSIIASVLAVLLIVALVLRPKDSAYDDGMRRMDLAADKFIRSIVKFPPSVSITKSKLVQIKPLRYLASFEYFNVDGPKLEGFYTYIGKEDGEVECVCVDFDDSSYIWVEAGMISYRGPVLDDSSREARESQAAYFYYVARCEELDKERKYPFKEK